VLLPLPPLGRCSGCESAAVELDEFPAAFVVLDVVSSAEQAAVGFVGGAAVDPVLEVVDVAE
jgi:hypothetical protein